jgi:L-ascorbate metabolism protein UlaG (beta-lactamase superfamily)
MAGTAGVFTVARGAGRALLLPLLAGLLALVPPAAAWAACLPVAGLAPGVIQASLRQAPGEGEVRLTFVGHASFLIESPGSATAVTDYNGVHRPPVRPDVATMNNAHTTHFTDAPDPGIAHVLRGWAEDGRMAEHDVTVRDMRVRNVPTNVRDWSGGTRQNGNSIFVFEVGGLCIAHLGHLHHDLTDEHLAALGVIDVLLVPVDGGFTMAQEFMLDVIRQIRPAVVVPMHYFNPGRLQRFLDMVGGEYPAKVMEGRTVTLSRATLPWKQTIVLPGPH